MEPQFYEIGKLKFNFAIMDSFNFSPRKIANYFTCTIDREAGDSITHLKLQKMIYYAQAWSMVMLGKTLFDEDFQAWTHGPVLQTIWDDYKEFGIEAIPICVCDHELPEDVTLLLEDIKNVYGEKTGKYLENLTHSEKPWLEARGNLPLEARSTTPISKDTMLAFYKELYSKNHEEAIQ
jgi:uncharacterized phage-associated protein